MCDGTRLEILSRELAAEFWNGHRNGYKFGEKYPTVHEFAENRCGEFENIASHLLKVLDSHED